MSPDGDLGVPPAHGDFRVVPLLFGDLSGGVRELEGFCEVVELVVADEMMSALDVPVGQLLKERCALFLGERGNATTTWDADLVG